MQGEAERSGTANPGEEMVQERPSCFRKHLSTGDREEQLQHMGQPQGRAGGSRRVEMLGVEQRAQAAIVSEGWAAEGGVCWAGGSGPVQGGHQPDCPVLCSRSRAFLPLLPATSLPSFPAQSVLHSALSGVPWTFQVLLLFALQGCRGLQHSTDTTAPQKQHHS